MSIKYVQTPTFYIAGAGTIIGATTVVLTSFSDIYGNVLTMTSFGDKGYITLEPDTTNEEAATFTGIVHNANGTFTLTGVKTGLAQSPYTETSGLVRQHNGGTKVVVTDNVEFWNTFTNKNNDETIDGQWTFNNTPIVPGTVSDASTTVKGVSKLSVAPLSATNPIAVGTNDNRVLVDYAVDSVGTDSYAITPSPAITAYSAGQVFTFKAGTANTGVATLNVSGLGAKTIKKDVSSDLDTGDILLNQIVMVEYDGTNMQLISPRIINASTQLTGTIPNTNLPTPAFQQGLPLNASNQIGFLGLGSNQDGSILVVYAADDRLVRYVRDSITGAYFATHTVTTSGLNASSGEHGITILGNFVYVAWDGGTNVACSRYALADLSGEASVTISTNIPSSDSSGYVIMWNDGTSIYINTEGTDVGTVHIESVSGTTFTQTGTATSASAIRSSCLCSIFDGTNAYILNGTLGQPTIVKLTNVDGSTTSTTGYFLAAFGIDGNGNQGLNFGVSIDSSRMYVGKLQRNFNATVETNPVLQLVPISKP